MKLTKITTILITVEAPLALAQTDPMPETTAAETTYESAHLWNNPGGWWNNHFRCTPADVPKFTCNELSFDMFASYVAAESGADELFETDLGGGTWGGGLGINYFVTPHLGIGGDLNMPHNGGHLVDNLNGSLIARLPFQKVGLAPYLFGGGGRTTEPVWEWTGHAGIGLEFRMNPLTGIFVDGRYVWADRTSDNAYFRAGFRFVF